MPPAGSTRALRGTLVHALLEELDLAPGGCAAGGRDEVVDVADARTAIELDRRRGRRPRRLVEAFAASAARARGSAARAAASTASTASRSRWRRPGHAAQRRRRRARPRADGGALVVDYKTDRARRRRRPRGATSSARYGVQRRVYALAALRAGAPASRSSTPSSSAGDAEPVTPRYEAADAAALEAELLELAAGLLAGDYPVTAAPHGELCATCPGRRALCSWPEEMTARPAPEVVEAASDGAA